MDLTLEFSFFSLRFVPKIGSIFSCEGVKVDPIGANSMKTFPFYHDDFFVQLDQHYEASVPRF